MICCGYKTIFLTKKQTGDIMLIQYYKIKPQNKITEKVQKKTRNNICGKKQTET